jgi:MFS family permease
LSASEAGLALIPLAAISTCGAALSGRTMARARHYKRVAVAGDIIAAVSGAALALFHLPLWGMLVLLSIFSFGLGTTFPITVVSIQNAVARPQVGTVTGAMNFFRALASTLVVAVMGAIVLAGFGVTPERGTGMEVVVQSAAAVAPDVAQVFRHVFAAALIVTILGFVAVLRLEERPLRGPAAAPLPIAPDAPGAPAE